MIKIALALVRWLAHGLFLIEVRLAAASMRHRIISARRRLARLEGGEQIAERLREIEQGLDVIEVF